MSTSAKSTVLNYSVLFEDGQHV